MGRNGREFTLYKFRSMCPKKGSNSSITVSGDVRITPVGVLLRRYKLDELPQFWNVLRGDMSLVGPRPKLPHHEALHMACRPGITGVATLAFRKEEEFLSGIPEDQLETFYEMFVKPAKAKLDLEYMRTATLASDLKVLWRTASACLFATEESQAESAETITQYEEAARVMSGKYWQTSEKHTVIAPGRVCAGPESGTVKSQSSRCDLRWARPRTPRPSCEPLRSPCAFPTRLLAVPGEPVADERNVRVVPNRPNNSYIPLAQPAGSSGFLRVWRDDLRCRDCGEALHWAQKNGGPAASQPVVESSAAAR